MKKKTIQPQIGADGKYPSVFKKEMRSWASSGPDEFESGMREHFDRTRPNVKETIAIYEEQALAIIERQGHKFNKPYNYFDVYKHDLGEYLITDKIKAEIGTEDWHMTYSGRAAEILNQCQQLKSSIEGGNLENTARHAMLLQREIEHLNFKQWDLSARIGEGVQLKMSKAAEKGADTKRKINSSRNLEIIKLFNAGTPTSIIALRYGLSISTIQRVVKPHR